MPSTDADKSTPKPKCFIAMPITTRDDEATLYGDPAHWEHVLETLFVRAVESAGLEAVRPAARGAHMIHGEIIRNLSAADIVLCDLSAHNPNVFFELGVRTSVNKPIALVRDENTTLPFDTSGINTYEYDSHLLAWDIDRQRDRLAQHIKECIASCAGENPLWRQFALTIKASEPVASGSPQDAKMDLILGRMDGIQRQLERERNARIHERESAARIIASDTAAGGFDSAEAAMRDLEIASMAFLRDARALLDDFDVVAEISFTRHGSAVVKVDRYVPELAEVRLSSLARGYGVGLVILERDRSHMLVAPARRTPSPKPHRSDGTRHGEPAEEQ